MLCVVVEVAACVGTESSDLVAVLEGRLGSDGGAGRGRGRASVCPKSSMLLLEARRRLGSMLSCPPCVVAGFDWLWCDWDCGHGLGDAEKGRGGGGPAGGGGGGCDGSEAGDCTSSAGWNSGKDCVWYWTGSVEVEWLRPGAR